MAQQFSPTVEDKTKPWYASRAVWGGIIAVGSAAAGALGYNMDAEVQLNLVELLPVLGSAIGGLLAVVGRIKADSKIGRN